MAGAADCELADAPEREVMRPVDQTILQIGHGNCLAACLASILELPCDDVPPVSHSPEQIAWLRDRGFELLRVPSDAFEVRRLPEVPYVMTALSPRAPTFHAVVCRGGEIVWDPHPLRHMGLGGPAVEYLFLVPTDPERRI